MSDALGISAGVRRANATSQQVSDSAMGALHRFLVQHLPDTKGDMKLIPRDEVADLIGFLSDVATFLFQEKAAGGVVPRYGAGSETVKKYVGLIKLEMVKQSDLWDPPLGPFDREFAERFTRFLAVTETRSTAYHVKAGTPFKGEEQPLFVETLSGKVLPHYMSAEQSSKYGAKVRLIILASYLNCGRAGEYAFWGYAGATFA